MGNPVDISTGQGVEEVGERRGAKTAVEVRDEAGLNEEDRGRRIRVRFEGVGMRGTENNQHKS